MALGIGEGAAIIGTGMGIYNAFRNKDADDRRQINQQQKLTDMQAKANEEAANRNQTRQMEMWNATNYGAQKAHMEAAGLNPALMYGMSGGGGTTTGSGGSESGVSAGSAANSAQTASVSGQLGMQMGQAALIAAQVEATKAQAEKTKAETENISGVDTELKREGVTAAQFDNEVKRIIGAANTAERWALETEKIETESQRMNAEWEAYQAAGFKGKSFNDPNSPIAKALTAGWDKVVTELEGAKTENNIKKAEQVIEEYKAGLAKQGISPDSPWYIKILGDLMEKVGIPMTKGVEAINKVTQ